MSKRAEPGCTRRCNWYKGHVIHALDCPNFSGQIDSVNLACRSNGEIDELPERDDND